MGAIQIRRRIFVVLNLALEEGQPFLQMAVAMPKTVFSELDSMFRTERFYAPFLP
jgi:hypothetical protein